MAQISLNPSTISDDPQTIQYTPFHSVRSIMEGDFDATFLYGPDDQRRKMQIEEGGLLYRERCYIAGGLYERDFRNGEWRNLAYINTPTGQEAVYITDESTEERLLYLLNRDYLNSILALTDEGGSILEEYSYDAWGNRRDPQTWQNQYNPGQSGNLWAGIMYRGFTGHEHLDCFGLINMNGRVYDPLLGRMLSPDNFVQNAGFSQNLNRYSYAYNNPLKFSDPDGEFIFTLAALLIPGGQVFLPAAIGADIGAISGAIKASQTEEMNVLEGAALGALVGAIGGAIGMTGGGTLIANIGHGVWQGAFTGVLNAGLWGETSQNNIFQSAIKGALLGAAFASVTSLAEMGINSSQQYGFRTNRAIEKQLFKDAQWQPLIDYVEAKYLNSFYDIQYSPEAPASKFGATFTGKNITPHAKIYASATKSLDIFKEAVAHEFGHLQFGIGFTTLIDGSQFSFLKNPEQQFRVQVGGGNILIHDNPEGFRFSAKMSGYLGIDKNIGLSNPGNRTLFQAINKRYIFNYLR